MKINPIVTKVFFWALVGGVSCNFVLQNISYAFYKKAKPMEEVAFTPEYLQFNEKLSGYGYNLASTADKLILFFGGSNYIAYNSVGCFGGVFSCPFLAADFYGSQQSKGKMNLALMQQTAVDLYEWAKRNYPGQKIIVMGHSYGTGIAAYLASVRNCDCLILLAAYRDLADLYNKIIPLFHGPMRAFITNDIRLVDYAPGVKCKTWIIGSKADRTLSAGLQAQVKDCFNNAQLKIFDEVGHEDYLRDGQVLEFIKGILLSI